MQFTQLPTKWFKPFAADDANKVEIPLTTAVSGRASQSLGFPPITMQPPESGGVPPQGEDFNGAMNQVARIAWWAMAGGALPFDATWAANAAITGYPQGARIASADLQGEWVSLADNNQANPDTTGTNWVPGSAYGFTTVSGLTSLNVTLSPAQAAKRRIIFSGTLTGSIQIIFPTWLYNWELINNTTGAFSLTAKTAAGSGVVIPQNGGVTRVAGDGTNIVQSGENIAAPTAAVQAAQAGRAGSAGGLSFRRINRNGNFNINQRTYVSGTATTGANQFTLDGWKVQTSGQSLTFSASGTGNAVVAPAGGLAMVVEGADIAGGSYCASWVGAGTLTANGSAVANGGTFTLPANTNATFVIVGAVAKLQIERGTIPTDFEDLPLAVELARCQRYAVVYNGNASTFTVAWGVGAGGTSSGSFLIFTPVPLASVPTISDIGTGSAITILNAGTSSTAAVPTTIRLSGNAVSFNANGANTVAAGSLSGYTLGATSRLLLSADI